MRARPCRPARRLAEWRRSELVHSARSRRPPITAKQMLPRRLARPRLLAAFTPPTTTQEDQHAPNKATPCVHRLPGACPALPLRPRSAASAAGRRAAASPSASRKRPMTSQHNDVITSQTAVRANVPLARRAGRRLKRAARTRTTRTRAPQRGQEEDKADDGKGGTQKRSRKTTPKKEELGSTAYKVESEEANARGDQRTRR